jgi:hypothetical protein
MPPVNTNISKPVFNHCGVVTGHCPVTATTKKYYFKSLVTLALWASVILWLPACSFGSERATVIPPERPVGFEIQTAIPTRDRSKVTVEPEQLEASVVLPFADAPTHTPGPIRATLPPTPAEIIATEEPLLPVTPTLEITPTAAATRTPKPVVVELDPPLQGGDWDFEAAFVPWPNPYGEPCPGASVAAGWTAFVEKGQYGSSCLNENLYRPNVFSGGKSQEITFDFIAANSGVYRTTPTKAGHRYSITAIAKHDHSLAPVEMALGLDLTGGTDWQAQTVQWFAWDESAEDTWVSTEETITATGDSMTIFIKGVHPMADQGGKTVIDNVSVTHLGK